jgi:hypothetical protein
MCDYSNPITAAAAAAAVAAVAVAAVAVAVAVAVVVSQTGSRSDRFSKSATWHGMGA